MCRLLFLSVICVAIAACGDKTAVEQTEQLRPVRVHIVNESATGRLRTFSGVSRSSQESRLSFKVGGTVVAVPVQVGDELQRGTLIAELSRSEYELQVQQADAALAQAQANQRNASANYNRVRGLYENSNASRNELDVARASSESAEAQVRSASKSLEIAELNRSYTRLESSGQCVVASVDVELNENVSVGTLVARVNCGGTIEVQVGIPESLIASFNQGMTALINFDALPGQVFQGTVTEVGVGSASGAATYPLVVTLDETGNDAVRAGMAAEVSVTFSDGVEDQGYLVPAAAVINDERGTFVFVATPDADERATIERRTVQIGELTDQGILVLSGLAPGDRVVTAGTSVIRENQTVLLPQG